MDALEFLKERKRMCKPYKGCKGCPLERGNCGLSTSTSDEKYERIIAAVEKWAAEHPRKTRQSVFLEQYPEANVGEDGVLRICPCTISAYYRDKTGGCGGPDMICATCRREFWMQEVE